MESPFTLPWAQIGYTCCKLSLIPIPPEETPQTPPDYHAREHQTLPLHLMKGDRIVLYGEQYTSGVVFRFEDKSSYAPVRAPREWRRIDLSIVYGKATLIVTPHTTIWHLRREETGAAAGGAFHTLDLNPFLLPDLPDLPAAPNDAPMEPEFDLLPLPNWLHTPPGEVPTLEEPKDPKIPCLQKVVIDSDFYGHQLHLSLVGEMEEEANSRPAINLTFVPMSSGPVREISVCSRLRFRGHKFRYELHNIIYQRYRVQSFQDMAIHNPFAALVLILGWRNNIPDNENKTRMYVLSRLFHLATVAKDS